RPFVSVLGTGRAASGSAVLRSVSRNAYGIRVRVLRGYHEPFIRISYEGLSSYEPGQSADEVEAGEDVSGGLFVAGCDGANVRDEVEATFDEVARSRERDVALARRLAIGPRRNDGLDAADFAMRNEAVAIIAVVGEEGCGFDFLGQDVSRCDVVHVA